MPTLASLLTRDAVVSIELIERALERQTLEGGELDSALLELDAAPENVLAAYRAATFRLDAAGRGELLRIEAAVIACVPVKLAELYRAVPIAMQEGSLIVAACSPLTDDALGRLEAASESPVAVRIATEARIAAALERHYGVAMSERMRRLAAELDVRNPGALLDVDPDRPSKRFTPPPPPYGPSQHGHGPSQRTLPLSAARGAPADAPVQVTRVVELAEDLGHAETQDVQDATETRPMRPSKLFPSRKPEPARPSLPPTPQESELFARLAAAPDRAAVEDAILLHVAARFTCTALFEVRDKHLMGRTAIGLPEGADARAIEAPMSRGLQSVVLAGHPRVIDLLRDCPGDSLPALIDRMAAQPCAILPIALSKRVVIAIYADRGGRPIAEAEASELLAALAAAGQALERIVHDRKTGALEARRSYLPPSALPPARESERPGAHEPEPQRRSARAQTELGLSQPPGRTAAGIGSSISGSVYKEQHIDSEMSEAALRSLSPRSTTERPPAPDGDGGEVSPTVVIPRASARPSQRLQGHQGHQGHQVHQGHQGQERAHERPSERPSALPPVRRERPSTVPQHFDFERPSSLPPSSGPGRLLSHPPKGAGSYALRDVTDGEDDLRAAKPRSPALGRAAREEVVAHGFVSKARDPRRETARESVRTKREHELRPRDPRRDGDDERVSADVVSMPPAFHESLRPPAQEDGALNIDLSGEADRLVERLAASTPGEETPLVAALLRLGEAGIDAIVRRFPGPSWAPRGQLHKRAIAGRDLGPLPRALWAFEDAMVPAVQELLEAQHADARLYAAVLAGDRVHSDLLWPLYRRLFDPEGSVRLLVSETLPLYRNAHGFEDVLKSLRKRAADERETLQNRLAAIEAVAGLRDVGSIELLAELAAHADRQYSLPAQRALVAITGQDFGDQTRKWKSWYAKNAQHSRVQWLIESLMHGEERVRATAGNELQRLTQVYYGFTASAPKRERERAQDRYRAWWEQEGKAQFGKV